METLLIMNPGSSRRQKGSPPDDSPDLEQDGAKGSGPEPNGPQILNLTLCGDDKYTICRELQKELELPMLIVMAEGEEVAFIRREISGNPNIHTIRSATPGKVSSYVKQYLYAGKASEKVSLPNKKDIIKEDIQLYPKSKRVFVDGKEVYLKNREFELLHYFLSHPDTVFSREHLYSQIWGADACGDITTVTVHINRIRYKIEADPFCPRFIQTVWRSGYRYREK